MALGPDINWQMSKTRKNLQAGVTCAQEEIPLPLSGSLEALLALALGPDTEVKLDPLAPCLKVYSAATLRLPKPRPLVTVASESL